MRFLTAKFRIMQLSFIRVIDVGVHEFGRYSSDKKV
jgi:hypothetical protein